MRLRRADAARPLDGFLLAGDTASAAWIRELLLQQLSTQPYGRLLLRPGAAAPAAVPARSGQVCSCFDVSEAQIDACLAQVQGTDEQRLALLQQQLRCGTNCGSCVPELRRRVRHAEQAN